MLGVLGVATLTKVRHRRELLFASLPALFAIHQCIEGFVWLSLDGVLRPQVTHEMGGAFMLYAQGLLPFLLPLSVLLFEPDSHSRRRMLPFVVIGTGTALYMPLGARCLSIADLHRAQQYCVYQCRKTNNTALAVLYIVATCFSLFFSKIRIMVIFGAANLFILLIVMAVKRYAFTSVWCAYAAAASIMILIYFWKSADEQPITLSAKLFTLEIE